MRLITVILSVLSLLSCNVKKEVMRIIIFPTGVYEETYNISLYKNKTMKVSKGILNDLNMENKNFFVEDSYSLKTLNNEIYNEISHLLREVMELDELKKNYILKGGWEIIAVINGKKFHFYYGENVYNDLKMLIEIIMIQSEINIHSWS